MPNSQSLSYEHSFRLFFSTQLLAGVMAATDALGVFSVGIALYVSYLGWSTQTYATYVGASALGALLLIATLNQASYYAPQFGNNFPRYAKRIAATWTVIFLVLVLSAYVLKISSTISRVWSFAWFVSALSLILIQRVILWQIILKAAVQGKLVQRTAILGAGDKAKKLLKHLEDWGDPWITVTGIFDDRLSRVGSHVKGYPVRGNLTDLLKFISENPIDVVLIALPCDAEQRVLELTERLREFSVHVYLAPDLVGSIKPEHEFESIAHAPMLRIAAPPISGWRRFLKEAEDRLITFPLFILFLPLMLVIAAAIKLDSAGPVFYRQERCGFNKKTFKVLKFRTMYHAQCDGGIFRQAQRNDARVTRVGKLLRRISLDELPQLINVLRGDMSLIGPRPHPLPLDEQYANSITGYFSRNRVKPGITGWAQVNGFRGETDTSYKMEQRVAHDIYYINNWSLSLDIQILMMTVFVGFVHKHAY